MTMDDYELDRQAEQLVDRTSINRVLESLMRVCMGKAEHLECNWQDKAAAKEWERLAQRLEHAQDLRVLAIP